METNSLPKGGSELLHAWCPVQTRTKSGVSCQTLHSKAGDTSANGFSNSMCRIEIGSLGNKDDDVIIAPCNDRLLSSNNQKNATPDVTKEEERKEKKGRRKKKKGVGEWRGRGLSGR